MRLCTGVRNAGAQLTCITRFFYLLEYDINVAAGIPGTKKAPARGGGGGEERLWG